MSTKDIILRLVWSCASTLARKANAGDMPGACAELSKWVFANKAKLPGLVKRRAAEREVCES